MHPWMAQIHPGFRTGLIAWLIARAGILTMLYSKGALAPSELDPAGAPLWGALVITTQVIGSWAGWAMLAAGEIAMLGLQLRRCDAVPLLEFVRGPGQGLIEVA